MNKYALKKLLAEELLDEVSNRDAMELKPQDKSVSMTKVSVGAPDEDADKRAEQMIAKSQPELESDADSDQQMAEGVMGIDLDDEDELRALLESLVG